MQLLLLSLDDHCMLLEGSFLYGNVRLKEYSIIKWSNIIGQYLKLVNLPIFHIRREFFIVINAEFTSYVI